MGRADVGIMLINVLAMAGDCLFLILEIMLIVSDDLVNPYLSIRSDAQVGLFVCLSSLVFGFC